MGSAFLGINTALRGLLAQQTALDVTGHNIANLNTEGYSRQRAEFSTTTPHTLPARNSILPGQIGTGVEISSIERLRDQFIDNNIRQQLSNLGTSEQEVLQLRQLESMFGEPGDSGISAQLQRFFSALDDVAAHPDDMAARQTLVQMADALATGMNELSAQITNLESQSDAWLNQSVSDINSITSRIAQLNTQISESISIGLQPNDLRDERDRLLDQLASKLNVTYTVAYPGEEVTVTMGPAAPINLVNPGGAAPYYTPISRADLDTAYTNGDLSSGEVFAHERLLNTTLPMYLQRLDDLANQIVGQMNTQHAAGFDLAGGTGNDFWTAGGTTAASISVDAAIAGNPRLIAAASSWAGAGEPGNGNNANTMLSQRGTVWGPPLNASWEDFYISTVTDLGNRVQVAQNQERGRANLVDALQGRRDEVSGVSLDEEMTNMLKFQHAYNASARILTTMDDALDTLINRMGRVGL